MKRHLTVAAITAAAVPLTGVAVNAKGVASGTISRGGVILFNSGANGVPDRWFVVTPSGADKHVVLDAGTWARLSPDGTKLAFGCMPKLCVRSIDGGSRHVLVSPRGRERLGIYEETIAWAPAGRLIAYSSQHGVWTVASNGRHRRLIIPLSKVTATSLAWSPDGKALAFIRNLGGPPNLKQLVRGHVYVVDADGSRLCRLGQTGFTGLSWSPNGRFLTWAGTRAGRSVIFKTEVRRCRSRRLATGTRPQFSPNGHRIVFEALAGGSSVVAVMRSDGTHRRTLGHGALPVWSPDGRRIALAADGLTVMLADGRQRRIVATAAGEVGRLGSLQWVRG